MTNDDRETYLAWLEEYCQQHGVDILAYCLMSNYIHLVAVPTKEDGLQRVMKPIQMRYASIDREARKAMCDRGNIFRLRWMNCICGPPVGM